MTEVAVGVDPGGRTTGICARRGSRYLDHALVAREGDDWEDYRDRLLHMVAGFLEAYPDAVLAVESLNKPSPHMGITSVTGLMDTSRVIGWLDWFEPMYVAPAKHGSNVLAAYPDELVSARERSGGMLRVGTGRLRHARSAFDLGGAALLEIRMERSAS